MLILVVGQFRKLTHYPPGRKLALLSGKSRASKERSCLWWMFLVVIAAIEAPKNSLGISAASWWRKFGFWVQGMSGFAMTPGQA